MSSFGEEVFLKLCDEWKAIETSVSRLIGEEV
jgi:hypothetical protein